MKNTIKLTETDLMNLVKKVLNEQPLPKGGQTNPPPKKGGTNPTLMKFSQLRRAQSYYGCDVQKAGDNSLNIICPDDNIWFQLKVSDR